MPRDMSGAAIRSSGQLKKLCLVRMKSANLFNTMPVKRDTYIGGIEVLIISRKIRKYSC